MPGIEGLGHVGIHTEDLMKMRDFYTRVMGLQIADENLDRGIVFLSANPEYEHHEFVLARGRDVPQGAKVVQQISFKVGSRPKIPPQRSLADAVHGRALSMAVEHVSRSW